jgi:hypothetical protein
MTTPDLAPSRRCLPTAASLARERQALEDQLTGDGVEAWLADLPDFHAL